MFPFRRKVRVRLDKSHDIFLEHEHFVETDFSSLKKVTFNALGCTFERCDFSNMRPSDICFGSGHETSRYIECRFDGSKLKIRSAGIARFERCSFLNVDIDRLFTHAVELIECTFSGVLRRSVFFGRVSGVFAEHVALLKRSHNEVRGNDFSAMRFIDVGFRGGVDLTLQTLPVGDDYLYLRNAGEKLTLLRQKYLQQPPSRIRQGVFEFVRFHEAAIRDGQVDLFLCKESESSLDLEVVDTIWNELRVI